LGAVRWNFSEQGVIRVAAEDLPDAPDKESFELSLIDAGAEDIKREAEGMTIYTAPHDFQKTKQFLESKNIKTESAEIEYAAKERIDLSDEEKNRMEKFIEELESNEDVSDYYTNVN